MLCTIELTEREQEIFDEVMEKIEETAAFLAGLPPADRLDWLKEHQYSYPISFEREIDRRHRLHRQRPFQRQGH